MSAFPVYTTADLHRQGMTRRKIADAVAAGTLIRARRGHFVLPGTPEDIIQATRVGGRLTCLSLLQQREIFVHTNAALHVQVPSTGSRLRAPSDARRPLAARRDRDTVVHWAEPSSDVHGDTCVPIVDALAHSVRCQSPRRAIATLDSALNGGHLMDEQLTEVFALLPRRFQALRGWVDGRAQSGTESLVRLIARSLGCRVDLQVAFPGVGFVDLVIDDWLVIECDSRAFHGDWAAHANDRRRDAALAALGFHTLRLAATTILNDPEVVVRAIRGLRTARDAPRRLV
ncbi:type IV toxin-antitoxin system AbiEi family antitoxin domain-containing protein [Microbacterium mangrovi]|uniref:type IV toxin-antitoxin system AbiEi family antitoxin domain-containing protein n=1 Tax=Microbacterium mangrovi TaxID=1348253 RepID=UPI00068980D9|nr:type IV toxin-antitoxin system AbiEi family antitoxin domain-containing protein [Microbacterium mangrovi]